MCVSEAGRCDVSRRVAPNVCVDVLQLAISFF